MSKTNALIAMVRELDAEAKQPHSVNRSEKIYFSLAYRTTALARMLEVAIEALNKIKSNDLSRIDCKALADMALAEIERMAGE